jgi:hypothetical protein
MEYMINPSKKYLKVQFHLGQRTDDSSFIMHSNELIKKHPSNREYHKIKKRSTVNESSYKILQDFARKHAYEYEIYKSRNEIHLHIPDNYLTANTTKKRKGYLHDEPISSNKNSIDEELSLLIFLGDVVFKIPENQQRISKHSYAGSYSLIHGFIKTSIEKKITNYTKNQINELEFFQYRNQLQQDLVKEDCLTNQTIGLIQLIDDARIISNLQINNNLEFETSADLQLLKTICPKCKVIVYTEDSILSALEIAIGDKINKPSVVLIQYDNSVYDYSTTEQKELEYAMYRAALKGITIISTIETNNEIVKIIKDNIFNTTNYDLKCEFQKQHNNDNSIFPIEYQNKYYKIPLEEMNSVLWAIRTMILNCNLGFRLGYYKEFLFSYLFSNDINKLIGIKKNIKYLKHLNFFSKENKIFTNLLIRDFTL